MSKELLVRFSLGQMNTSIEIKSNQTNQLNGRPSKRMERGRDRGGEGGGSFIIQDQDFNKADTTITE